MSKRRQNIGFWFGLIASAIAIAQVFTPVRKWTAARARELYPDGWLVVAGSVVVLLAAAFAVMALQVGALRRRLHTAELSAAAGQDNLDQAHLQIESLRREAIRNVEPTIARRSRHFKRCLPGP